MRVDVWNKKMWVKDLEHFERYAGKNMSIQFDCIHIITLIYLAAFSVTMHLWEIHKTFHEFIIYCSSYVAHVNFFCGENAMEINIALSFCCR